MKTYTKQQRLGIFFTNLCVCVCVCVWQWLCDLTESPECLSGSPGRPLVSPGPPHLHTCPWRNVCASSLSPVGCVSRSSSIMTRSHLGALPGTMTLLCAHAQSMLICRMIYDLGEMTSCLSWMISPPHPPNGKGGNPSFDSVTWLNLQHDILPRWGGKKQKILKKTNVQFPSRREVNKHIKANLSHSGGRALN